MQTGRIRLSIAEARRLAEGALQGIGYSDDDARIIADHVIDAALCGYEYSGLPKILNISESRHFRLPRRPMRVLRETGVSLAFDGGNNVGMLARVSTNRNSPNNRPSSPLSTRRSAGVGRSTRGRACFF